MIDHALSRTQGGVPRSSGLASHMHTISVGKAGRTTEPGQATAAVPPRAGAGADEEGALASSPGRERHGINRLLRRRVSPFDAAHLPWRDD